MVGGLQISSQLARNSEKYYEALSQVFSAAKVVSMCALSDSDAVVAKVCNLVGNLCRHSGRYYAALSTPVQYRSGAKVVQATILELLARYCGHRDAGIRKFASFAGTCVCQIVL